MGKDNVETAARRRSAWAGLSGVAVALGATEFFSGLSVSIPSAISSIGAVVVDITPPWLESFAIAAFGTADKAVLGLGIIATALIIGWFLGRASVRTLLPILVGFVGFGALGIASQLAEVGAAAGAVVPATVAASGIGLLVWSGIRAWTAPRERPVTDNDVPSIERRRLLLAVGAAATVSVMTLNVGRARIRTRAEAERLSLDLPTPAVSAADPTAEHDFGLRGVAPIVVSNATFYRIDTALVVPRVDPQEWTLTIKGIVDREVVLSYDEILSMPLVERYATLACVSNEVGDRLIGNALWTGVPLSDILNLAGVREGADQIVGRSVDGWTAGFPTEIALDGRDSLVAVGMNREVLPADHGFPARLVVPGLYGYVSATKWLSEIELTTWDAFDGYWIPRGWSKEGPIKTQSRIDRPKNRSKIDVGPYTFAGVAWAPNVGIEKVEVQIDDGPWEIAELTVPLSVNSWVQWGFEAEVAEGSHTLRVRATDATGATQSERPVPPRPDGAEGYHRVHFKVALTT